MQRAPRGHGSFPLSWEIMYIEELGVPMGRVRSHHNCGYGLFRPSSHDTVPGASSELFYASIVIMLHVRL